MIIRFRQKPFKFFQWQTQNDPTWLLLGRKDRSCIFAEYRYSEYLRIGFHSCGNDCVFYKGLLLEGYKYDRLPYQEELDEAMEKNGMISYQLLADLPIRSIGTA